jgi:hypothetical protein
MNSLEEPAILQTISKTFLPFKASNPLAKDLLKKEKNTITKINNFLTPQTYPILGF